MKKILTAIIILMTMTGTALADVAACKSALMPLPESVVAQARAAGQTVTSEDEHQFITEFTSVCDCVWTGVDLAYPNPTRSELSDLYLIEHMWMPYVANAMIAGRQPGDSERQLFITTLDSPAVFQAYMMKYTLCTLGGAR